MEKKTQVSGGSFAFLWSWNIKSIIEQGTSPRKVPDWMQRQQYMKQCQIVSTGACGGAAGTVAEGLHSFFSPFSQFTHLLPESWAMASPGKQFTLIHRVLLEDSSFLDSLNWSESKPVLRISIIQGYSSCPESATTSN